MVNRTLPTDWEWTTVGEVGKTITGSTPPKSDSKNYGDFIPFIKPPELNNGSLWKSEGNLSEEGAQLARVVPEKAVLVSCIGNLGKTGIAKRPIAFNQQINAIVFPENVLPEFGFYYFQSSEFRKQLEDIASATTISIVNKSKFNSLSFPLAPLPEQERIVNRIEELFSDLDAGVGSLERVSAGLKRYKASVLKVACEGKLFGDVELSEDGLPMGWRWTTVGEIGEISGGLTKNSKRDALKKKMPYLRVANVYANELQIDDVSEIGVEEKEIKRALLQDGDLLVVEGNGSPDQIGRVAIWNGSISPCLHQNHIIKVRFEPKEVAEYVLYWLLSEGGREQITKVASSTSGLYTLSLSKVSNLPIPLPPLNEQRRIVAEVERRLSMVGEVESAVEVGLVRAGRLRQSVLRSAFEGRL